MTREGSAEDHNAAVAAFEEFAGRPPEVTAVAPGRVNLIGEHTDYNGGFVLPMAIPQTTRVELARRADGRVRARSANLDPEIATGEFELGAERRTGSWLDYVQGVTFALSEQRLAGFDVRIASTVPPGSGLASSAALEVALLRGLRALFALELDDLDLSRAAQRAENEIVGAPVGIMDPLACALARQHEGLLIDTETLGIERVPLPPEAEFVVIDSGQRHNHAAGDYRTRRAECEEASRRLGVARLRGLTPSDLPVIERLPAPLDRRARHVVTENARVLAAVGAARAGDLGTLGELLDASHASLRDDFAVSTPDVDALVEMTRAQPGVLGARITGGGFGGAVLALARRGAVSGFAPDVVRAYRERTGRTASVLVPNPS